MEFLKNSRLLFIVLVLTIVFTLGNIFITITNITKVKNTNDWVSHTTKDELLIKDILNEFTTAETSQRKYLLTGNTTYLQPYTECTNKIKENIITLQNLTKDNPVQQKNITLLTELTKKRADLLNKGITTYNTLGYVATQQLMNQPDEETLNNSLRTLVTQMSQLEDNYILAREQNAANSYTTLRVTGIIANVFNLLLIIGTYYLILQELKKRTELNKQKLLQQKLLLKAQEQEQQKLSNILESISDAFVALDTNSHFTYVNKQAERLFIKKRGDLVGKSLFHLFPEVQEAQFHKEYNRAIRSGKTVHFICYSNGLKKWFDTHIYPAREGISIYFSDYTKRKIVEDDLKKSELRFRRLVESNMIGVIVSDIKGNVTEANEVFLKMIGYSTSDLNKGLIRLDTLTPKEFWQEDVNAFKELQETGNTVPWEKEYIRKDGSRIHVHVGAVKVHNKIDEVIGFAIDMTEHKRNEGMLLRQEKELLKSRNQLDVILQNVTDGIIVYDNTSIIYNNEMAATLLGYKSASELRTATLDDILQRFEVLDEEKFDVTSLPSEKALKGELNPEKIYHIKKKAYDEEKWYHLKARPVFDKDNKVQFVVAIIHDVTEQQLSEKRKNEFISMASHELKTPLTSMKLFLQILEKMTVTDTKAFTYIQRIKDQSNKLTELVADLLDVSRIETGKLRFYEENFRLNELVEDTIEGLRLSAVKHSLIISKKDAVEVKADRFRIYQVVTNLITNAVKYSPKGDKVIIKVEKDTTKAIVSIKDYGIGIDKNQFGKIFEKLYQVSDPTERTFPGIGMGLYISNEIIKRHGGDIWVKSQKGKGSTFYFSLPIQK